MKALKQGIDHMNDVKKEYEEQQKQFLVTL